MVFFTLSKVFSNNVHPPKSINCLDGLSLNPGKSLVPAPPHKITGFTFI